MKVWASGPDDIAGLLTTFWRARGFVVILARIDTMVTVVDAANLLKD